MPPYHKEEVSVPVKSEAGVGGEASEVHPPPSEPCEVNLDYIHAYEEGHAVLPVRPDVLLLPSDLKPFVKVMTSPTTAVAGECWALGGRASYSTLARRKSVCLLKTFLPMK